jgi:hypothetical protein
MRKKNEKELQNAFTLESFQSRPTASSSPPSKTSSSDDNAVDQGAAPNTSSVSRSEISPESNNSKGNSPRQSEDCESETDESKCCECVYSMLTHSAYICMHAPYLIYVWPKQLHTHMLTHKGKKDERRQNFTCCTYVQGHEIN